MPKRYFKTTITLEVLSEDEPVQWNTYEDLIYQITEGHCSGHVIGESHLEIDEKALIERCEVHHTDPTFFTDPGDEDDD